MSQPDPPRLTEARCHPSAPRAGSYSSVFRPGDRCDKYRIVKLIASGGIGEVYEAIQTPIDRRVAIKCLQTRHSETGDLGKRMGLEAKALGRICHPNVVTVFDAGCTDTGMVWIAMELLEGQTLRQVLRRRKRLSIPETLGVAIAIARGVEAAHDKQIIHRDLKPENVFITSKGTVKVVDLGMSKLRGWGEFKTSDRGVVVGTPAYMSPEHIQCLGVDERSDVYAMAIVLYEMLAGHPFAACGAQGNPYEVAAMHIWATPVPLRDLVPEIVPELSAIISRALCKTPEDRPQTMGQLISVFEHALAECDGLRHARVLRNTDPPFASLRIEEHVLGPCGTTIPDCPSDWCTVPITTPPDRTQFPTVSIDLMSMTTRMTSSFPQGTREPYAAERSVNHSCSTATVAANPALWPKNRHDGQAMAPRDSSIVPSGVSRVIPPDASASPSSRHAYVYRSAALVLGLSVLGTVAVLGNTLRSSPPRNSVQPNAMPPLTPIPSASFGPSLASEVFPPPRVGAAAPNVKKAPRANPPSVAHPGVLPQNSATKARKFVPARPADAALPEGASPKDAPSFGPPEF